MVEELSRHLGIENESIDDDAMGILIAVRSVQASGPIGLLDYEEVIVQLGDFDDEASTRRIWGMAEQSHA